MNKLRKKMHKRILITLICVFSQLLGYSQVSLTQENIDYSKPTEYIVGGITIEGTKFLDHQTLIQISGIEIGQRMIIPGDDITKAIKTLWKQGLFADIQISVNKISKSVIYLSPNTQVLSEIILSVGRNRENKLIFY